MSDEVLARTTGDEHSHLKALFKTSAITKDHGNALTLCIVDYSKPFVAGYLDRHHSGQNVADSRGAATADFLLLFHPRNTKGSVLALSF